MSEGRRKSEKPGWESSMNEEMRFHLEQQTAANVAAGMDRKEARRQALLQFGGMEGVKEECREEKRGIWLEALWADARFGARMLRKSPGFTLVAVITLALGIGANTAIFSVINGVLLRPLPFGAPDRLVTLWQTEVSPGNYPLTGADYLDWQAQNRTLEATSLYDFTMGFNTSGAGEPEAAAAVATQANFFSVLGVQPMLGRGFVQDEDAAGKNHVVVLSYGFWKRHFGGRRDVIDQTLELNEEAYTVIGVMPNWFRFPGGTDLWIPQDMSQKSLTPRGTHQYRVLGRLLEGVTPQQAQADLVAIASQIEKDHPDTNDKVSAVVVPMKEQLVGDSRTPLLVLLGAVALVLMVACANLANLMVARATRRSREIAVRAALGAGRRRIIQQLLTESLLLSLAGAAIGCLGAYWFIRLAQSDASPLPAAQVIRLDFRVLIFTMCVSVVVALLSGLAPALQALRVNLSEELKAGAASVLNAGGGRRALRDGLVIAEMAVSLALLLAAGLLLRTFRNMRTTQIGVDPQNVLTARIVLPDSKYATREARRAFFDSLLDRVRQIPGADSASISTSMPLAGGTNGTIDNLSDMNPAMASQLVEFNFISPDYFHAYRIPVEAGRTFSDLDEQHGMDLNKKIDAVPPGHNPPDDLSADVIISAAMARDFWPKQDPVGKVFQVFGIKANVIGVVGDAKEWDDIRHEALPQLYFPVTIMLDRRGDAFLTVKTRVEPASMAPVLRREVTQLDAGLALFHVRTMDEIVSDVTQATEYQTILLGSFAAFALLLAAVGIYGVMAYAVTERRHEFGIRMALGAEPWDVLRMVLMHGTRLALAGVVLGAVAALIAAKLIATLVFGVSVHDPLTFAAASVLLLAVALAACYLPARRAMRVDPMVALRYE